MVDLIFGNLLFGLRINPSNRTGHEVCCYISVDRLPTSRIQFYPMRIGGAEAHLVDA